MKLTNLDIPFTFQFNVTAAGTPEQLTVKKVATTIAFNDNSASPDTITDSASGFLTAGFQAGDQITVSGASNAGNNATFVVVTVAAGVLTLRSDSALTTEAAGATVKIIAPKTVPEGIALVVKAKYANGGQIYLSDSSAKALSTSGGGFSLRNNENVSLQIASTNNLWIDSTVSGEGVEVLFEKMLQS